MINGWTISKSISIADVIKILGLVGVVFMFVRQSEIRDQAAMMGIEKTMYVTERNAEAISRLTIMVERHEVAIQTGLLWRVDADARRRDEKDKD